MYSGEVKTLAYTIEKKVCIENMDKSGRITNEVLRALEAQLYTQQSS